MKALRIDDGWLLRLEVGEELVATLLSWLKERDIPGGELRGLGALRDVVLGYFDLQTKTYQRTALPQAMELVALIGNISWLDGEPVLHAHATLAGPELVARGGHLFAGTVSATVELFVRPTIERVTRALDPETNLNLLDI